MSDEKIAELAKTAVEMAAYGAAQYLSAHNLTATSEALAACLKSWIVIKFDEGWRDAKLAYDCDMSETAALTFELSMIQAGIEAAKEAGRVRQ